MNKLDKLLKSILEEEMTSEMRTWLMELALLIDEERALRQPPVSGSFSQKDMENFAAKCMLFGHQGKTTLQLLKDFCDNDR